MRNRIRVFSVIAVAFIGASLLSGTTPIAHADDPLAAIRGAVNGDRSRTACPAFAYSQVLQDAAQAVARYQPTAAILAGYHGKTTQFIGYGDPEAEAINRAYKKGAGDVISECSYTDFGVGFVREELSAVSGDYVAIVFGTPAAAKPPSNSPSPSPTLVPTPAAQQCPPGSPTPTVPAFGTCAPPSNAVRVSFAKGLQWTVTVTSTADIAGTCTYAATNPVLPGTNKTFDISPRGSASFTVSAPPPFSTYHVVVSCTGTFNGSDVVFGHVEQDVSA